MTLLKRIIMGRGYRFVAGTAFANTPKPKAQVTAELAALGVEVERFLKQRGDTKAVVLCRHPRWGQCVYKGYPASARIRLIHAHTAAARLTAERESALFPTVHEVGGHYSFEAFVPGTLLSELSDDRWGAVDLVAFADSVRTFGIDPDGSVLLAHQRARIVEYYVRKAFHDVSNGPLRPQGRVVSGLARKRAELRALVDAWRQCEVPALTSGWSINDLNVRNVIRDDGSGAMRIIDSEDVGRGHFMFDLVWFLAHTARLDGPGPLLEGAYRHMFRDGFCGSADEARFFRHMLAFLLAMNAIRWPSAATRHLAGLVESEVEHGSATREGPSSA